MKEDGAIANVRNKGCGTYGMRDFFLKFERLRWIFVDECSTLGCEVLASGEDQARQHIRDTNTWALRGRTDKRCFGGLNLCFAGDFWQFKPIHQTPIYDNPFKRHKLSSPYSSVKKKPRWHSCNIKDSPSALPLIGFIVCASREVTETSADLAPSQTRNNSESSKGSLTAVSKRWKMKPDSQTSDQSRSASCCTEYQVPANLKYYNGFGASSKTFADGTTG